MFEERNFVEQAEYIPREEFLDLSSDHPNEKEILKKLAQSGAKLITGPRGCGKTTLILKAFYSLLADDSHVLPIYVNYKTSLKLEPNYKKKSSGTYIFATWMYLKILKGLYEVLEVLKCTIEDFDIKEDELDTYLEIIELGQTETLGIENYKISVNSLQRTIDRCLKVSNRKRCVIYFDDAAHAFSSEQQNDFFELFRRIKNKEISPKAAIYPGITNFSPTFNIGHDAEQINVWINPEDSEYETFMLSLLQKRLPVDVYEQLMEDEALLLTVCYSSFGLPRQLLNMVRNFYSEDGENFKVKFNRSNVNKEIRSTFKSTMSVFTSLEDKLPTYKNYILEGEAIFEKITDTIYNYNRSKDLTKKSLTIAVNKPMNGDIKRIFGFYQYAGLIAYKDQVSRGEKGAFNRYLVNISALIVKNAILTKRSPSTKEVYVALSNRNAHEFTRIKSDNLLITPGTSISLTLPPCQNCGAERLNEDAKFCYNCGAQLRSASIYEKLVGEDISSLKLTPNRVATIKKNSSIRKVKDIITDIGNTELKNVPQVGDFWTKKIKQLAEEYIS